VFQASISTYDPPTSTIPAGFSCSRARTATTSRITLAGELDLATVAELDRELRRAEQDATMIVLDLRALEFMDLSAAQLVLTADRRIRRAGGRLVIVRGAEVAWFLTLVCVDHLLEFAAEPVESGEYPIFPQ